jgi:hypothetical protein
LPKASVVSLPPLPKVEQLVLVRLIPARVVVPVTSSLVPVISASVEAPEIESDVNDPTPPLPLPPSDPPTTVGETSVTL